MNFIITILVGAAAGFLADLAFKRFSFSLPIQILLGIGGAFVGNWLLDGELNSMLGLPDIVSRIAEAFCGAAVILFVIILFKKFTTK